jgi:hypothetical protein
VVLPARSGWRCAGSFDILREQAWPLPGERPLPSRVRERLVPLHRGLRGIDFTNCPPLACASVVTIETLTPIYGPRQRCKRNRQRDRGLRQSIRLQFGAVAPSQYGYPLTSVLNNSPASRRAMASNQASESVGGTVSPFVLSVSRKARQDIVSF